ncbi:MAG TPA: hypothetical protein VM098_04060, partial [Phycisphaerae bacterium]|nr:hypothetical protein [Phycisphaerae bacterium]
HSLTGLGGGLVNRHMAAADKRLKADEFYEAADMYGMALMYSPASPFPRVGRGLAFFGAGEPITAASEFLDALRSFPPLMEARLNIGRMMRRSVFDARLAELDSRLKEAPTDQPPDAMLPFLACFLHQNVGDEAKAKQYAKQVQQLAGKDSVIQAYCEFVLTGKRPTTQPTTMPSAAAGGRAGTEAATTAQK